MPKSIEFLKLKMSPRPVTAVLYQHSTEKSPDPRLNDASAVITTLLLEPLKEPHVPRFANALAWPSVTFE
jgi:hypothetical protein